MKQLLLVVILGESLLSACHHHPARPIQLDEDAGKVRIAKSDPPDNYTEIGPISATDGSGCGGFGRPGHYEAAVIALKNRANTMGADYVQILTITQPYSEPGCFHNQYRINGTAFKKTGESPSPLPIVQEPQGVNVVKGLQELEELRKSGVITQKEFNELKSRLLAEPQR